MSDRPEIVIRCEVHGTRLEKGRAYRSFGNPRRQEDDRDEARRTLFPHTRHVRPTICFLAGTGEPDPEVFFCPECGRAEQEWREVHRPEEIRQEEEPAQLFMKVYRRLHPEHNR